MNIILIFIIAVSLSMDAFSLSLAYGTISISKQKINTLSIIVGIFHFFMPIFGLIIGSFVEKLLPIGDLVTFIIFLFIGINMIIESKEKQIKVKNIKLKEMILFGFAVSIDSFSIGIGLKNICSNLLLCSSTFSFVSFIFTYIGLILGSKLNKLIGKLATLIGGISLILLGIIYLI